MEAYVVGAGFVNFTRTAQARIGQVFLNDAAETITTTFYGPTSDVADGNWTDDNGSQTNLYSKVNEEVPDDRGGSYVQSGANPSGDVLKLGFPGIVDPAIHTNHRLHYRIRSSGEDVEVSLVDGDANTIATWNHSAGTIDEYTTFVQTLSGAEAGNITDYVGMQIWVTAG